MDILRVIAALACLVSVYALVWQARRAQSLGRPSVEAPPRGRERDGLAYAFGRGLAPWAKEGGRHHLLVYVAGVIYHAGIVTSLLLALLALAGAPWPAYATGIAAPLLGVALVAGLGLLVRRVATPRLRALSSPDDFVSNFAATLLVASALVAVGAGGSTPSLLVVLTLVLLYAPLGKIRHCVFFFLARARFGRFIGRRGVLRGTAHGVRP